MIITALPDVARNIGTPRIVQGVAITNPTGDPKKSAEGEVQLRRDLVLRCIRAAHTPIENPTLFQNE